VAITARHRVRARSSRIPSAGWTRTDAIPAKSKLLVSLLSRTISTQQAMGSQVSLPVQQGMGSPS